jgi:DNA-directed RNA polymerase subunit RPC12/RpoP
MSDFKFYCPQCGQHYKGDTSYSGREMECLTCHSRFLITGAPAPKADATVMKPPTGQTWDTHVARQAPAPGGLRLKRNE